MKLNFKVKCFLRMGFLTVFLILSGNILSAFSDDSLIHVEGGTFTMHEIDINGNPTGDRRKTEISSFLIGKHQVTVGEFEKVRGWAIKNGYEMSFGPECPDNHPAAANWYSVIKWCNALSEKMGLDPAYYIDENHTQVYRMGREDLSTAQVNWQANGYRLPTEAEWEFAARGGNQSRGYEFSGGDDIAEVAWYRGNSQDSECPTFQSRLGTWPVGMKKPNELGIHDMTGNMAEWCWDWHSPLRSKRSFWGRLIPEADPKGANFGRYRICRGADFGSSQYDAGVSRRLGNVPGGVCGFRVVRKAE